MAPPIQMPVPRLSVAVPIAAPMPAPRTARAGLVVQNGGCIRFCQPSGDPTAANSQVLLLWRPLASGPGSPFTRPVTLTVLLYALRPLTEVSENK